VTGLINNVLYVIILSAALDLVGPDVPKGVVLLADVIPSFLTKLCAPYFIHAVPYHVRILIFCVLSASGMLLIALTPAYTEGGTITTKMAGVILASLSSGGGELSFLGLTHFYGPFSLAAWGSGTGAAGLIGAGAYALATTSFGLPVKTALLASSFLPVIMLVSFFVILPLAALKGAVYTKLNESVDNVRVLERIDELPDTPDDAARDDDRLLSVAPIIAEEISVRVTWLDKFKANLNRSKKLFFPL
jgi:battenin